MTFLLFFIILSVLILIHELGHFWTAKKNGILVEEFGFGLPPRIWGKKIGETIYSINWLPIGGFVRLYGEEGVDGAERRAKGIAQNQKHDQRSQATQKLRRAFFAQSKGVRALVLTAGVIMNFLLGVVVFGVIYSQVGIPEISDKVHVVGLKHESLAAEAGLRSEDVVTEIDVGGRKLDVGIESLATLAREYRGEEVGLKVARNGDELELVFKLPEREKVYFSQVVKGSPAAEVGLMRWDRVIKVARMQNEEIPHQSGSSPPPDAVRDDSADSESVSAESSVRERESNVEVWEVEGVEEFIDFIGECKGEELKLVVLRGDEEKEFVVMPRVDPPEGEGALGVGLSSMSELLPRDWEVPFRGSLTGAAAFTDWGLAVGNVDLVEYPAWQMPLRGAWHGVKEAVAWGLAIVLGLFWMLRDLFVSGVVPTEVAGPVGIFQMTGDVVSKGLLPTLQFVGILSVNLAILNIMPFPALDGGRLLFLGVEAVIRRRVSGRVEQWAHGLGMLMLLTLLVLVTLNDFVRITGAGSLLGLVKKILPFW